jgi:uncharacterized protein
MKRFKIFAPSLFICFVAAGCGGTTSPVTQNTQIPPVPSVTVPAASPSATEWVPPTALVGTPRPGAEATLTAAPGMNLKTAPLSITNKAGETINMTVEIADTEDSRQLGLMFRSSMPPDAGMLFDFQQDTNSGFWMQNTILPLSIAFIKADGTIIDIKDMQPLDTTAIGPSEAYRYALETNQGFFAAHKIAIGDHVALPGAQSVVIPGMPSCHEHIEVSTP